VLLDKYTSINTLYLVIGMNDIECGVFASAGWIESSLFRKGVNADQTADSTTATLPSAILGITADLGNWIKNNPSLEINHLRVLVADSWLPSTSIPWSSSLIINENLAKVFALNQFNYAGFNAEPTDTVKFLEHSYGKPALAIAYPRVLVDSINLLASTLKLKLTSILPVSIAAWHVAYANGNQAPVLGIYSDNLLIVSDFSHGLVEVKTRVLDENNHDYLSIIASEWGRIKLRANHLTGVENLPLINLSRRDKQTELTNRRIKLLNFLPILPNNNTSPSLSLAQKASSVATSADVIAQGRALSPLKWLVISVLLACINFFGVQIWRLNQQVDEINSSINSSLAVKHTTPLNNIWTKQELEQVRAINATIRQLNLPFATFMDALQPPRDIRVAILSLDIDAKDEAAAKISHIKIVAEAKTAGEMANYVSFLSHRKIFKGVFLVNHEIVETIPEHPYKFNIELLWESQS
jgi:hypothetical protein